MCLHGKLFLGPYLEDNVSKDLGKSVLPLGFPHSILCLKVFRNLVSTDKITLGCTHHLVGLIICERSAVTVIHYVKRNVLLGVLHWFIKGASLLHVDVQLGQES